MITPTNSEEVNEMENLKKTSTSSFKLDPGAQLNVILLHVFHQLECDDLKSTTQRLFVYGGKPVKDAIQYTLGTRGVPEDNGLGISECKSISDDNMLVRRSSKKEHDRNLKIFLERTREVSRDKVECRKMCIRNKQKQERMKELCLQKYDLTVRHKPGKEIPVADTLSRLHLSETDNTHEAFDAQVYLPVSDQKMSDLQASTASADPVMQQLIAVIKEG
ncbi:hypothetical protein OS493_003089 [Desmophyllum pertusum]|uniref:Uncharacterized protein n=1 Tax=Desmophyllum pertusum TaxID=174260 RepID=A0A9W9YGG2_9CNID|nr:hypothetical protein OS493_003089 [Desmophyllum pertusum]